jgi:hypothetical protein
MIAVLVKGAIVIFITIMKADYVFGEGPIQGQFHLIHLITSLFAINHVQNAKNIPLKTLTILVYERFKSE